MMKIIHSDDSIEKLTEAMPLWWADRHTGAPWTEAEQNEIFRGLVSAARSANIDQMRWFLDEWGNIFQYIPLDHFPIQKQIHPAVKKKGGMSVHSHASASFKDQTDIRH
jgi:hypothetical protein